MLALITGATKGIGYSISHALAKKGYDLILNSRTAADLKGLKKEISEKHPELRIATVTADLSSEEGRKGLLDQVGHFSCIDALINNAGVFQTGKITEESDRILKNALELNLMAPYHLTRALLPQIQNSSQGHVVNICSVSSLQSFSNAGSYSISKHAMLGFSRNLRHELIPHGIKVTAVLPGSTWSDSWKGVDLPRTRLMEPEEVAKVVVCALSLGPSAVMEEVVLRPFEGDLA